MSILFDPRDARCKSPFGAVTTFAAVDFTFYPRGHAVTGCTLLAHHEFSDRWTETELLPTTDEDGAPAFSGTFFAPSSTAAASKRPAGSAAASPTRSSPTAFTAKRRAAWMA